MYYGINMLKLKNPKKIYIIIVGVWMLVLLAFRGEYVGNDTRTYMERYAVFARVDWKNLQYISELYQMEYFFAIFNKALALISDSPRLLIIVTSILFVKTLCDEVYRTSVNPCLSFVIYVGLGTFTGGMNTMRQQIALSFIICSYKYIKEKKLKEYMILILAAAVFHKSALVMLPMYWVSQIHIDKKIIGMFMASVLFFVVIGDRVAWFVVSKFYPGYIENFGNNGEVGALLIYTALLFITIFYAKGSYRSVYLSFGMVLIYLTLLTFYAPIAERLFRYFSSMFIFAIPNAIGNIRYYSTRKAAECLVSIAMMAYFFLIICGSNVTGVVPYKFMWAS